MDYIICFGGTINVSLSNNIFVYKINKWFKSKVVLPIKLTFTNVVVNYSTKCVHLFGGYDENYNRLSCHLSIRLSSILDGIESKVCIFVSCFGDKRCDELEMCCVRLISD